jgi:hypothetical protein
MRMQLTTSGKSTTGKMTGLALAGLLLGLSYAPSAQAGSPTPLSGGILGQVKSGTGIAQMGATVLLYNRYDQLVKQALTNPDGKFVFDMLTPDLYSIRVTLASFVPAMRRNIAVAAGSENLLQINLATLFSSIDLVSAGPSRGALMSDEWKWVLRSSQATRPVLRLLPVSTTGGTTSSSSASNSTSSVFSDTTGVVRLSAGDGDSFTTGAEQDLGTAFAVATSIYGSTRMQFSGNIGYSANSTIPAAGFRTSYSRNQGGQASPQIILTVRQLYLPGQQAVNGNDPGPVLRTLSLAMRDKVDLTDRLRLEYGVSMDAVSFLSRLNYVSPFARATYSLGNPGLSNRGSVRVAYSGGSDPSQLIESNSAASTEAATGEALSQDLAALAQLPRISLRDDQMRVQRTQNFEGAYQRVDGSRTYSAGVYAESVSNASFMLYGARGFVPATDTLPDLGSNSYIFNAGNYNRRGYTAAVKQALGDRMDASVGVGRAGALTASPDGTASNDPDVVRTGIQQVQRMWATAAFSATMPVSGTRLTSSYGWTDSRALMPDHVFLTQDVTESTGWNVRVRQPLPFFGGFNGRLEATAEMRNLLAQGYLPLEANGQKALLTNSPRAVRGGLAFIF